MSGIMAKFEYIIIVGNLHSKTIWNRDEVITIKKPYDIRLCTRRCICVSVIASI